MITGSTPATFSDAERAVAREILRVLDPHIRPAIEKLYRDSFGASETGLDPRTIDDEVLKVRRIFSLEFDAEYLRAKQAIVSQAVRKGIEVAHYPLFFESDFANFLTPLAAGWRMRGVPLREAFRVFSKVMLTDVSYSMGYFIAHAEEERMRELLAIKNAFRGEIAERVGAIRTRLDGVAQQTSSLSDGAARTLGALAESQSRPEEVTAHVAKIADATRSFSASADQIAGETSQSAAAADLAAARCDKTQGSLALLNDASAQIGAIVKLITRLAAQTNLLALNASIEAARAGAAGRSFSVVAQEVKTLAQETAKATDVIAQKVQQVREASAGLGADIGALAETMTRLQSGARAVANAVDEQASAIRDIASLSAASVAGVDAIAQHASSVESMAGGAAGLARQVEQELTGAARLASELEASVGVFLMRVGEQREAG
ncbi:methyl-accepting chemotaxis protein [Terrarubrum flagellatum]|uniref:methyl-accepting chemotaxis protein n=1 Tax=Terrirubrum flagellatum TaxID=2895980 RepID=UPI0031456AC7